MLIPGVGTTTKGATRWLFGFQPSELAKDAVIICFAAWASTKYRDVQHWKKLLYRTARCWRSMFSCSRRSRITRDHHHLRHRSHHADRRRSAHLVPHSGRHPRRFGAFASYLTFEHVRNRVNIWLDPFSDMRDTGFQAAMGQIAIGSGGLFGRGLGNGMQKQLYLPEPHNDFIFATWCEEMGLIGALAVIAVFAYLIWRGLRIARSSPDRMGMLLATGITAKLAIQTLMNLFVVTGLMPVTGASLPFFQLRRHRAHAAARGNGHPAQCIAVYAHRGANRIAKILQLQTAAAEERDPFRRAEGCEGETEKRCLPFKAFPHIQFYIQNKFRLPRRRRGNNLR